MAKQLTPQEIEAAFQNIQERRRENPPLKFDFRRPDRIPKSQVRAIHLLHDNFVRNLVSSLSAYLRSYLTVNLVGVEQLSYAEFLEGLPSPTCMVSLSMKPYDGNAVLELNPGLTFSVLEMVLGGSGKTAKNLQREITEIEQKLLDGLFRIILHDLEEAWKPVASVEFRIDSTETEPQLMRLLAPSEAVVAVAIEIRIGETVGLMNLAMPSIVIKMMRQKFDEQWLVRKTNATESEQARILAILNRAKLGIEVLLRGPTLSMRQVMALAEGDVITFAYPVHQPLDCLVNGKLKFHGQAVNSNGKRALAVQQPPYANP